MSLLDSVGFNLQTVAMFVAGTVALGLSWSILSLFDESPKGMKSVPLLTSIMKTMEAGKNNKIHLCLSELNEEYGDVVKFNLGYIVSDKDLVYNILRQVNQFPSRGQSGLQYFIPNSLLGYPDNCAHWKTHRKILSGAFTDTFLKMYVAEISSIGHEMVQTLRRGEVKGQDPQQHVGGGTVVANITQMMNDTAYRVLAHTIMGGKEWYDMCPEVGSKEEVAAVLQSGALLTFIPRWLWSVIPLPPPAIQLFHRQKTLSLERIVGIRKEYEAKQQSQSQAQAAVGMKESPSLMHFLVTHPAGLTDDEVGEELMALVVAGHETTANTLSFAMLALAMHPMCQTIARTQIREVIKASKGDVSTLQYEHINQLPFIWALFRETLRLFPTVPFTFRVPNGAGNRIRDVPIPDGSRVFLNMHHIGRSERYFKDALEFNPDRWLEDDAEAVTEADMGDSKSKIPLERLKNHDSTFSFGGGLRSCIGKRFAEEESILLMAMLILNFNITIADEDATVSAAGTTCNPCAAAALRAKSMRFADVPTISNITMTMESPVALRFTPV